MDKKILKYDSEDIKVTYDLKRCIHAAECVKGLPEVFDPNRKPWIKPENGEANAVADVIEKCPTGALHYEMKGNSREEQPSSRNRIQLTEDGPVYFFGDIEVQDHEGNTVLKDTRFALCRCGASANKPACDNTHQKIEWEADADADKSKMPEIDEEKHDKLLIKLMKNGPAILEGSYTMESAVIGEHTSDKGVALCRCGGSTTKPFCDGTHKEIGFEG
ncbi:MAG: CDGSH iron-sulfur domain-containing protein [Balneolaceae bacterium]|nr:CDGSH iron-sulfur domain-containing protein [Balneolaceae bacterium]MCH8549940.1 CDGSH iron-sulfur domain-containing protein [Balneolaceae bacterium]